ncbi:hypothetical protein PROFUN_10775 [Planoprotostelium fungivorum]|uniref:Chitin deacetylase n=1 Tax=Planoprotostelium fungivorum TaxID=1890364 RepID=A0A2P6NCU7_9EUKA|nr:hypothetical protein PROFUN_10775 [Planoprotostelium fungivorum]
MTSTTITGHCHCKSLQYSLEASKDNLDLSAYCHCSQCQRLNGAPFIWTTHWKGKAVKFSNIPGEEMTKEKLKDINNLSSYNSKEQKYKLRCTNCGTPMGSWSEKRQGYSLWPSTLERTSDNKIPAMDVLKPTDHIFYGSRSMDIQDNLPKWEGYPNQSKRLNNDGTPSSDDKNFHAHGIRDIIGYGNNPPHPRWPGNARLALSFVLNYEEGGENTPLNGDTYFEQFLTEGGAANGVPPTPGVRNLSVESAYEYGSHRGFWRILDLFKRHKMRFTSWSIGKAVQLNPAAVKAMEEADCEVASHSDRWINYIQLDEEEEKRQIKQAIASIKEASSQKREPRGWYTGRQSVNTRRLVYSTYKEMGLHHTLYDSDAYDEDLPYWVSAPDGTPDEYLLVIPYTFDNNDMKFAITPGFYNATAFSTYLIDAFETLIEESQLPSENPLSVPKMMSVGLHCRVVGRPGRFKGLVDFVKHVERRNEELKREDGRGVWIATREEIAQHWRENHPPKK